MFATPDQIIASVVKCFNQRSDQMGFGSRSSANLPVLASDLIASGRRGGDSAAPVSQCRHICIYVIATHCVMENPFSGGHKQIPFSAIGSVFNMTKSGVYEATKIACLLLANGIYAQVYQSALDDINAQGLELWRAKFTRINCA